MYQTPIIIFVLLTLFSCNSENKKSEKDGLSERYIERESPFTELFYYRIKENEWIRHSENIMTVHETFKQDFYQTYLTSEILDQKPFLEDGRYKVVYDDQFSDYPKFEFEVKGQNLTEINSDPNRRFRIEQIGKNSFQLKSLEKQTVSLTDFQKALTSHGQAYYELTGCEKDTIYFTLRVNLHVISYSGKFVRIN